MIDGLYVLVVDDDKFPSSWFKEEYLASNNLATDQYKYPANGNSIMSSENTNL